MGGGKGVGKQALSDVFYNMFLMYGIFCLQGNTSKLIAEIVALFITAMDKIKLDIRSMDEIHGELKVSLFSP
jgi:hypothetical protein